MNLKPYLLSKGYSNQTIKSYHTSILHYITWCDQNQIESEISIYTEVLSYIQYLKSKNLKQRSIQQHITSLKQYFNWLIYLKKRDHNPTLNIDIKGVKRRQLYNILSKQELEKLYKDYKEQENTSLVKKRNEIIVSLLVYQGLNSTELSRLTIADVHLREGTITIQQTRRSNERELQLESHQILDFMEYQLKTRQEILQQTKKETDLLFTSLGSSTKFSNIISKLLPQLKKLNKKLESVHQLRTSVITHWLKQYNLREVQYRAGHKYVSSTEAYLINDLEDLQEDINKYHPIV